MGSKKRSAVWLYFENHEQGKDKSLCNICSSIVQTSGGNTSNMLKHLRTRHPEEFAHIQEVRKMRSPTSSGNKKTPKIKQSREEREKPAATAGSPQLKREVRIRYEGQEMKFLVPFTENPGPEDQPVFDQSHATELSPVEGGENYPVLTSDVGEIVFSGRRSNEWQDLYHESLRPHLKDMDRQQQRQYIARVSQVVMEILNP